MTGIFNWIGDNWVAAAALVISVLGWLDSRRRYMDLAVNLQAEQSGMHRGEFLVRNRGNKTIYNVHLDAEKLAGHRIDDQLHAFRLVPRQPAKFRISADVYSEYPDGVHIRYRLRPRFGQTMTQYVPIDLDTSDHDPSTGELSENRPQSPAR